MASCAQRTVGWDLDVGQQREAHPRVTKPASDLWPEQKARAQKRLRAPGRAAPFASLVRAHGPGKVRNTREKKCAWEGELHRPSHTRSSPKTGAEPPGALCPVLLSFSPSLRVCGMRSRFLPWVSRTQHGARSQERWALPEVLSLCLGLRRAIFPRPCTWCSEDEPGVSTRPQPPAQTCQRAELAQAWLGCAVGASPAGPATLE